MFKVAIKADVLKGLVNIISTVVDEVKFTITPESMNLVAVDPSHVSMIELIIEAGAFESYEADETEIGIDLDKIKEVLKLSSSGEIIGMEQDEGHGRLTFKVGNITRRMNLVDTSAINPPKIPALNLSSYVELAATELQKGIKASENISDHIKFIATTESFELVCEGDTDSASLKLEKSQLQSINVDGEVSSMFPLDYLSLLVKALPSDLSVRVELDNDFPVKMIFGLADGKAKVTYLLAPRIEND